MFTVTSTTVEVVEVWGPHVVVVNDGAARLVGGIDCRLDVDEVATVTVRWLHEAHTPFVTERDLVTKQVAGRPDYLNRCRWLTCDRRLRFLASHNNLVVSRLSTGRWVAVQLRTTGYGCVRCGAEFATFPEWVQHYGTDIAVPTRIPWTSVRLEDGGQLGE